MIFVYLTKGTPMAMREFRVQGPPGCGKTTYLKTQVENAAGSYGANRVVVCSLTRSAASHVAAKVDGVPRENIGTVHAMAYRALPGVKIAEVEGEKFNEWCGEQKQPTMKIGMLAGKKSADVDGEDLVDVPLPGETTGDRLKSEMGKFRARMIRRDVWPESVRAFATLWERWKKEAGYLDFTDLLEIALRDVAECPQKPAALFGDESQDCSRLAFSLLRKWGERCLRFVHVGDTDQLLYHWAGVDIAAFFEGNLPDEQTRLLHKSYRVPRAVHAAAVRWIDATPGRKPVHYLPRDSDGAIRRLAATTDAPRLAIEDAKRKIGEGKTVLFLVSCSYMLTRIIGELRDAGIPYHNPYRIKRGDWNPLRIGAASPASRLASFLKVNADAVAPAAPSHWTNEDVRRWAEWLPTKDILMHGARSAIAAAAKERPSEAVEFLTLLNYFEPAVLDDLIDGNLDWWSRNVAAKHREQLAYPFRVYRTNGYAALTTPPAVIVSNIHAAKGGESDIVYLFPDLSPQAYTDWMAAGEGREGIRRAFYVGMTRAREELVLCASATNMAVRI
jgi:hypothetical protein